MPPVRRQIDDTVTKALGIDPEWVATMRLELAREPLVTDRGQGTYPEEAFSNAETEEAD